MKTSNRFSASSFASSRSSSRLRALHLLALCAALTIAAPRVAAESRFKAEDGFGVGFVLGSPTGLSASLPLNNGSNALNGVVGWDLGHGSALFAQGDYVWSRGDLFEIEHGKLSLYYGPGAFAVLSAHSAVGIRFVGGLDYRFEGVPLQAFLEVGPGINVLPSTSANAGGGLGLRYYF